MKAGVMSAVLVFLSVAPEGARVQHAAQLGNHAVSHVAIFVRNIDASVKAYGDVLGIRVPPVGTTDLTLPESGTVRIKLVFLNLPNMRIELEEPVDKTGPTYEFLQKFGPGIHHIGFRVKDGLDERGELLRKKGGTWNLGARSGVYRFFDFRKHLGTTIELTKISRPPSGEEWIAAPGASSPLTGRPIDHIGVVVRDIEEAVKGYSDVLGVPAPDITSANLVDYPSQSKANPKTYVKVTRFEQENTGIELLEPSGGRSTWADDFVRQPGNAAHHIAFNVQDRLTETIRNLRAKGGRWLGTVGRQGGDAAYFDFTHKLGVVIEVIGTAGTAAPTSK